MCCIQDPLYARVTVIYSSRQIPNQPKSRRFPKKTRDRNFLATFASHNCARRIPENFRALFPSLNLARFQPICLIPLLSLRLTQQSLLGSSGDFHTHVLLNWQNYHSTYFLIKPILCNCGNFPSRPSTAHSTKIRPLRGLRPLRGRTTTVYLPRPEATLGGGGGVEVTSSGAAENLAKYTAKQQTN